MRPSLAELVRELRNEGRIVSPPSRSAELECYRAVLARLALVNDGLPDPAARWPRAAMRKVTRFLIRRQHEVERKRGMERYEARRAERRRLLDRDITRWRALRMRIAPSLWLAGK